MTSAKYNDKVSAKEEMAREIETSVRTTRVDLPQIKASANQILGNGFALAWACKFALNGMKLKDGDWVSYKATKMTAADYKAKISAQANYNAKTEGGIGKHSDKTLVSAKRLVRAFAADISFLISKGFAVSDDTESLIKASGIPKQFAFIDSWYGMTDDQIHSNWEKLVHFTQAFDKVIAQAYASGWVEGKDKYSHYAALVNYAKWRGLVED